MCSSRKDLSMNKLITVAATALLLSTSTVPATAETPASIAIIDSGFDASQIASNVIEEVCIITSARCNNNKSFDIGVGASGTKNVISSRYLQDWSHGTQMAKIVVQENPNANVILIRNSKLYGGTVLPGTEADMLLALNWVNENADKYNIVAVSMSRGSHRYVTSNRQVSLLAGQIKVYTNLVNIIASRQVVNKKMLDIYQSKLDDLKSQLSALGAIECPATDVLTDTINDLQTDGIATIVATGNDADKSYADYPACIDAAVAVAAYDSTGQLAYVSNIAPNTDFVARGDTTSEATARLAGIWSRVYNGSYNSTYELITSNGTSSNLWSATFVR